MKLWTALFFVLTTTSVFANNVKITSFVYSGNSTSLAELCGVVEGTLKAPSFVKVTVDPGSRRPGTYNTVAGLDGKFCLVVLTYNGRVEASHFGDKNVSVEIVK